MAEKIKLTPHAPNVHTGKIVYKSATKSVMFGLFSDVHYDSKHCLRPLLKKHFDYIRENNGFIMIFGDWFDVMGTFRDPRSKGQDIRKEYLSSTRSYLDLIVEDSFKFLKNYKDNLLFMSPGNHETNITRRHDTDILERLVFLLNQSGCPVQMGGYGGYISLKLKYNSRSEKPYNIAYHHGGGGNAQRSKSILHSQLDAMSWPDADLIVSGHTHDKLHDPSNVSYYLNTSITHKIEHKRKDWIKTGSYKRNEENPLIGGWEVEKKFIPKDVGGYILELGVKSVDNKVIVKPKIWDSHSI